MPYVSKAEKEASCSRRGDGHADLSFVYDAAREIASAIEDHYLKTEAMIDTRIAKIMARLVGLKEYKKMYGQKPIEACRPVAAPTMLPAAELSADTEAQGHRLREPSDGRDQCPVIGFHSHH